MKSSQEDLRKRGIPSEQDMETATKKSMEELLRDINSVEAAVRTATVIVLKNNYWSMQEGVVRILLKRLSKEKALYTKIELCNSLEQGDTSTAIFMCDYLGKIGTNQHKIIPDAVSRKKSYPLPRDIIARSLGKMNAWVIEELVKQFPKVTKNAKYELLDAIGFGIFYNPSLGTKENFQVIYNIYQEFQEDELMVWKIALCCSAFSIKDSRELLEVIKKEYNNPIIKAEVERSIQLGRMENGND